MTLTLFIQTLISSGNVTVASKPSSITPEDITAASAFLHQYYTEEITELSYNAALFDEAAAVWAAQFFYHAVHLAILREAGEEEIKKQLEVYPGAITPAAIYSADLVLRHLPALAGLVKGLAPADILVQYLQTTATQWPLSSVGMAVENIENENLVLSDASLRQEYIDRIIQAKDKRRINTIKLQELLYETTGNHLNVLWPGYEVLIN